LKCFEVANSLADTALLASTASDSTFEMSSKDFLHALYQKLSPFLEQDPTLNSILRAKTAEALIIAPARLFIMEPFSPHDENSTLSIGRKQDFEIDE